MENLDWLQEQMQKSIAASAPGRPLEGILRFPSTPSSAATRDGQVALDLVNQAAEVVRGIEERAKEKETHAHSIAQKAVDNLQFAEKRIQELTQEIEAERRAAEAFVNKANATIREAAEALKTERSRLAAAENKLRQLEVRANAAEARAKESESAVVRVEEAIRIKLLGLGRLDSKATATAAAVTAA